MLGRTFVSGLVCLAISANSSPSPIHRNSTTHDDPSPQIITTTTSTFEATFATSSETCTSTIDELQKSLEKGDTVAVYSSVETFHAQVITIQATVEQSEFDSHSAVTYSETVAEVVVTYSTVVTTLSNHPSVEKDCHGKLKEINVSVQRIVNAYAEVGVCVKELVDKNGGIDSVTLGALDLQLHFASFEAYKGKKMVKVPEEESAPKTEDHDKKIKAKEEKTVKAPVEYEEDKIEKDHDNETAKVPVEYDEDKTEKDHDDDETEDLDKKKKVEQEPKMENHKVDDDKEDYDDK